MKVAVAKALTELANQSNALFLKVMEHGSMSVELYRLQKRTSKHRMYRMNYISLSAEAAIS